MWFPSLLLRFLFVSVFCFRDPLSFSFFCFFFSFSFLVLVFGFCLDGFAGETQLFSHMSTLSFPSLNPTAMTTNDQIIFYFFRHLDTGLFSPWTNQSKSKHHSSQLFWRERNGKKKHLSSPSSPFTEHNPISRRKQNSSFSISIFLISRTYLFLICLTHPSVQSSISLSLTPADYMPSVP